MSAQGDAALVADISRIDLSESARSAASESAKTVEHLTGDKRVDVAQSFKAADVVKAARKQCFYNSLMTYLVLKRYDSSARYVEGFAVMSELPLPFMHAWVETSESIVEPTLPDRLPIAYATGIAYTDDELESALNTRGSVSLPLVVTHDEQLLPMRGARALRRGGLDGLSFAPMRAAYNAAHKKAYGLSLDEMVAALRAQTHGADESVQDDKSAERNAIVWEWDDERLLTHPKRVSKVHEIVLLDEHESTLVGGRTACGVTVGGVHVSSLVHAMRDDKATELAHLHSTRLCARCYREE